MKGDFMQQAITMPENGVKEWSKTEHKRSKEISDFIYNHLYSSGEYCKEYDEEAIEDDVKTYTFPANDHFKQTTISISRCHLVTVPEGKHVTASNYYSIGDDGDVIDENYIGYKTFKDAEHAAQIYISDKLKQIEYWDKKQDNQ